ncbi:MAG: hypothetical protein C4K49_02285 [Candidatus Thorarchaeota archaeon]|nr:MAG: hypothetical protein C4K49_02285 [Candidatus Thorarchaeota archaeon]
MEYWRKSVGIFATVILTLLGLCSMIAMPVLGDQSAVSPEKAQVITVGTTEGIEATLDPALAYGVLDRDVITSLSSGLVDIAPGSDGRADDIVPALAVGWAVSLDGRVWDFQLRQGVTFENGEAFNASIVKYTFDRNCNLTGSGLEEPDGPQVNMGYKSIIENVTVTGEYSVRFFLHAPFAPFLQLMACAASYMVEPAYAPMSQLATYTAGDPRGSTSCGLGPYLLEKWIRVGGTDQEIWLNRNPAYWNVSGGFAVTERIIVKMYPSSTSLAAAIASGDVDVAYRQLTSLQIDVFRSNSAFRVWQGHGPLIQYMCFQQRTHPFDHVEVREAIAACFNRTELSQWVFSDTVEPLYSMVPNGVAYHQDSFVRYGEANYTYAGTMLAQLGFNESHKLQVDLWYETSGYYPYSEEQALVYEADLEASGVIAVSLHTAAWIEYRMRRDSADMPMFVYGWHQNFVDPDDTVSLPFADWLNMGFNSIYGGIAQHDYWIKGRSATTEGDRYSNYSALQDLQASECSVVPLWQSRSIVIANVSVSGVSPDISDRLYSWRLEMENRTSSTTTTDTTSIVTTPGPWNLTTVVVTSASIAVIVVFSVAIIRSRR